MTFPEIPSQAEEKFLIRESTSKTPYEQIRQIAEKNNGIIVLPNWGKPTEIQGTALKDGIAPAGKETHNEMEGGLRAT